MEIVSEELKIWLGQTVEDLQVLWGDVARLNRSRGMWMALSEAIEAVDPTNPWARNYDAMYFDAQLLGLTRVVFSDKGGISLGHILKGFKRHPELCGTLQGARVPDDRGGPLDPSGDRQELARLLKPFIAWRNKRVAHIERDPELPAVSWDQLDEAVVGVSDMFALYSSRVTGVNYEVRVPNGPPWTTWKNVFKAALFDVDGNPVPPAV